MHDQRENTLDQQGEITPAASLALMLETACEHFEVLHRLSVQELIISATEFGPHKCVKSNSITTVCRAQACIQMALAKSFIANTIRARRICQFGEEILAIDKEELGQFLNNTERVISVRDINEHGFDINGCRKRPSLHAQDNAQAFGDETSLSIFGPSKMFVGPLNLYDVFKVVDRLRSIAGFKALNLKNRQPA
jgi:hypothetical protein